MQLSPVRPRELEGLAWIVFVHDRVLGFAVQQQGSKAL